MMKDEIIIDGVKYKKVVENNKLDEIKEYIKNNQ